MPQDWGFEYDLSLWNRRNAAIPGGWPNCYPWQKNEFWAWKHNRKPKYFSIQVRGATTKHFKPYFDSDDKLDSCKREGLGFGIGMPRGMPANAKVTAIVDMPRGDQDFSVYHAKVKAVSNDCNDRGFRPSGWCMGLNTYRNRNFPGPGARTYTTLGEYRQWTMPRVCYTFRAGVSVSSKCLRTW